MDITFIDFYAEKEHILRDLEILKTIEGFWGISKELQLILNEINSNSGIVTIYSNDSNVAYNYLHIKCDDNISNKVIWFLNNLRKDLNIRLTFEEKIYKGNKLFPTICENKDFFVFSRGVSRYFTSDSYFLNSIRIELVDDNTSNKKLFWEFLRKLSEIV